MTAFAAFMTRIGDEKQSDDHWEQVAEPPYVVSYAEDDFVELPNNDKVRAYVNGFKIISGMHVLRRGDFVRIIGPRMGDSISFRFEGRLSNGLEPARGRRCDFTRTIINEGRVVRCSNCDCLIAEDVDKQIGRCVCGSTLSLNDRVDPPPEELL